MLVACAPFCKSAVREGSQCKGTASRNRNRVMAACLQTPCAIDACPFSWRVPISSYILQHMCLYKMP
eukprot:365277-Chlamydomonas_euryale.AAC.17